MHPVRDELSGKKMVASLWAADNSPRGAIFYQMLPCSRPNTLVMQAGGISVLIPRYSCARTGAALSSEHGYSGKGETGRGCG
jgi:hypothetical protein